MQQTNNGCPCKCHPHGAIHCWCFLHRLDHPMVDKIRNAKDWPETTRLMHEFNRDYLSKLGGRK